MNSEFTDFLIERMEGDLKTVRPIYEMSEWDKQVAVRSFMIEHSATARRELNLYLIQDLNLLLSLELLKPHERGIMLSNCVYAALESVMQDEIDRFNLVQTDI